MNINKVVFKGVKIAFAVMLVLLIVYGIMRGSFAAYEYGYNLAIESLVNKSGETDTMQDTQNTEDTENTERTGE